MLDYFSHFISNMEFMSVFLLAMLRYFDDIVLTFVYYELI